MEIMNEFSLAQILADAKSLAPTLCHLLHNFATNSAVPTAERRDSDLVSTLCFRMTFWLICLQILVTMICMLMHLCNGHSTELQTTTCIYLLTCGASCSQFDVLNPTGFTLSYTSANKKIKQLGAEWLHNIIGIAHSQAFLIIWDNLNIAFRVGEQRKASKDHFDNRMMATLIPLYGV